MSRRFWAVTVPFAALCGTFVILLILHALTPAEAAPASSGRAGAASVAGR